MKQALDGVLSSIRIACSPRNAREGLEGNGALDAKLPMVDAVEINHYFYMHRAVLPMKHGDSCRHGKNDDKTTCLLI